VSREQGRALGSDIESSETACPVRLTRSPREGPNGSRSLWLGHDYGADSVDLWSDIKASPATLVQAAVRQTLNQLVTPSSPLLARLSQIGVHGGGESERRRCGADPR
jgi:hypothetical protein